MSDNNISSAAEALALLKTGHFWKEVLLIIAGIAVGSASVYYFLIPGNFVTGSISGLAMVVADVMEPLGITVKVSTIVLVMNVILLIVAYLCLGSEVGIKTAVASLLLGPGMDMWEAVLPYQKLMEPGMTTVMGDPVFDILAFCLLLGASQAVLFRINASTGGLDIIAMLMKKYLHFEIGTSVAISGIVVCLMGFIVNPFHIVAIGIIGTWFNGLVVDYFTTSLNKKKRICIVSKDYDIIRKYIIETLGRGCSLYEVKGGYSGETNVEIQSILTQDEFANLMEYIRHNKFNTFITAGNCSEVYGLWLPHKKRHRE